jgi:citrate lyase subunit beta/citryl-CoA lyase
MTPRSFHFIPAHKPHLFDRLPVLAADRYVFDFEDAVPVADKPTARASLAKFFQRQVPAGCFVRIHETGHPEQQADLDFLSAWPSTGIVLPKFSGVGCLHQLAAHLPLDQRPVLVLVESFAAFLHLQSALESVPRVPFAIGLGFEDLLSTQPHPAVQLRPLLRHLRAQAALLAHAHGILAIDGITRPDASLPELELDCREGCACGLHAKFSVHPRQIATINQVFGPSPDQVLWARRIQQLTGLREDFGYQTIEEIIITPPKIKQARHILQSIGLLGLPQTAPL